MKSELNFYRIKMNYAEDQGDGSFSKKKTETLVRAYSYGEAESIAYQLLENIDAFKNGNVSLEIVKTKIDTIVYNNVLTKSESLTAGLVHSYFEETEDTGVGLYCVNLMFSELDETTGKEIRKRSSIYMPAKSSAEADKRVRCYVKNKLATNHFIVRGVKFDKTSEILCDTDNYSNNSYEIAS